MKPYILGIYEKAMPNSLSMEEKLLCAKEYGYDYMEMSIDETDEKLVRLDMSAAERANLLALMAKTGLPIRSICLSGHRKYPLGSADPATQQRSLEIMEKAIDLAYDLGVRMIQIAGYDVYYEESTPQTRADFLKNLKLSAQMAASRGVILAFETMETPFMNNCKKAMRYVLDVNSPYLQVYPDIGNCTNAAITYGEDVIDDICCARGHISAMHLKETVPGKFREIEFGTGHVDFERAVQTALSMNVRMFVTEFWDTPEHEYREHIAYSKKFIDKVFQNVLNSGKEG